MLGVPAILLLAALLPCAAKYRRYPLFELVCSADLVVSGKIVAVDARAEAPKFLLEVTETIVGAAPGKEVEVRCFADWTCASRWMPYAAGQREVVFLRAPAKDSTVWTIIGSGDEGEMPLEGSTVCANGYAIRGHVLPALTYAESLEVRSRVEITEFARTVKGFRDAHSWEFDAGTGALKSIGPKGSPEQAKAFAGTSPMARHMSDEALRYGGWMKPHPSQSDLRIPSDARRIDPNQSSFEAGVRELGDLDGDGVGDLVEVDRDRGPGGRPKGGLRIAFLAADGHGKRESHIAPGELGFPEPMPSGADFRGAVAPIGDFDGDHVPDVLMSTPNWKTESAPCGRLWVMLLERSGAVKRVQELALGKSVTEGRTNGHFALGQSLTALGDLDRDGCAEFAIGLGPIPSSGPDPAVDWAWSQGHCVLLVSLGERGSVHWVKPIRDLEDGFTGAVSVFGSELACPGDVDGDGINDLAISDFGDDDGGSGAGAVWIVFLRADGTLKGRQKISNWSGNFEGPLREDAGFGSETYVPGDLDGDGIPDLVAKSHEGAWFLSLNRDGTVREARLLPHLQGGGEVSGSDISSLVFLRGRTNSGDLRWILDGWGLDGTGSTHSVRWFLRFDATGQLHSW